MQKPYKYLIFLDTQKIKIKYAITNFKNFKTGNCTVCSYTRNIVNEMNAKFSPTSIQLQGLFLHLFNAAEVEQ